MLARLNNSLKDVGINYSVQIDAVPPTVRNRIIGEMLYVISLLKLIKIAKLFLSLISAWLEKEQEVL